MMGGRRPSALLVFSCGLAIALLVLWSQVPPQPVDAAAPPIDFSSVRALAMLRSIARAPHPVGSAEHERVREVIVRELSRLGVSPQVQQAIFPPDATHREPVTVRNILARLPGEEHPGAVLLACHYDSWPTSPGAADDGAAVAALLEVLRALRSGRPLFRDVVFLFTDAEEAGRLGARAFVEGHPWAREIEVVLNFDARGVRGPLLMYEPSPGNVGLLRGLAASGAAPRASSLFEPMYRLLPQRTDFAVFRQAGLRGLSFAFVGGGGRYHTSEDRIENLDERSLQDMGEHALALARTFGGRDPWAGQGEAVHFDLLGTVLIRYPQSLAVPLAIVTLFCFLAILVFGFTRRELTLAGVVRATLTFAACSIVVILSTSVLAWVLLASLPPGPGGERIPEPLPYLIALLAVTFALGAAFLRSQSRRTATSDLAVGAWIWWAILLLLTAIVLPQGSYLFSWPLAFASAGLAYRLARNRSGSLNTVAVALAAAVPGLVLWLPILAVAWMMIGLPGTGAIMGAVTLLAALLFPALGRQ